MKKLKKLKKMLERINISLEEYKFPDGTCRGVYKVKIYEDVYAIFNETSKGGFRLEIKPNVLKTEFEKAKSLHSCLWLELDELFKRIKYCVENNTDNYVEKETFEVGDEIFWYHIYSYTKIKDFYLDEPEYGTINEINDQGDYIVTPISEIEKKYGNCRLLNHHILDKETIIFKTKNKFYEFMYIESRKRELEEKELQKIFLERIKNLEVKDENKN